jgi:stearoyl-CoA desaturase (delta-9 desaturase)
VFLYVKESHNKETMERYGHGTPDDWIERNVYTPNSVWGVWLMGAINIALFGLVPGLLIWAGADAWIPFWAAGVINGIGHYFGYRNFETADASTNIVPWGILIGGEELHNNHHAFADVGQALVEVVRVRHRLDVHPHPRVAGPRDGQASCAGDAEVLRSLKRALLRGQAAAGTSARKLAEALKHSRALATALAMRHELAALWERSSASKEQLLRQLQDWCRRADASGAPLVDFSQRLRSYALASVPTIFSLCSRLRVRYTAA